MKLLISSLEPSANLHLEQVLKHLSDAQITGIFDERFGTPFMKSSEFSAMGFVEVLPLIFKAKRAIKDMVNLAKSADAVLLIDSPAFNLPLARAIKQAGVKTPITYYILPQVWAWKPKRVAKVERFCDHLASILPFDAKFYNRSTYVGHPLLDELNYKKQSVSNNGVVAFLPGSRKSEITRLMPVYKEISKEIQAKKLLVVPKFLMSEINALYGDVSDFEIVNDTPKALFDSDFAFICSGTATLEAALIGTPFVLCYKAKAIDVWLARKLVKVKFAGLANIIFDFMGKNALHDELIQEQVTRQNLLNAYKNCDKERFLKGANELREYLKQGSSQNVAKILNGEIK
ncbi:ipid-A-disaccharide synthase [Campylobacter mucosalis]|uniref:lipid-A-disaccharide synthase n=1 Tax=Campylobacter mucosalis TaxID=202 RepID=UPI0004D8FD92|nr:lipid-A-disaccharide synthase [Campylobacter mucosalis]KEA45802.1 ipid-A-disaccharide synthase [Campylobacter mucosalis]QKF62325.1 lipid A disaccharide synthase [Campylobacter mucosalis]